MNKLVDTHLASLLEDIRVNQLKVYMNIKANIECVYVKLAISEMEKALYDADNSSYCIYQVSPPAQPIITWYLKKSCHAATDYYLVLEPNRKYAALYLLDSEQFICDRAYIFDSQKVEDLFRSFKGYLVPINTTAATISGDDNPII